MASRTSDGHDPCTTLSQVAAHLLPSTAAKERLLSSPRPQLPALPALVQQFANCRQLLAIAEESGFPVAQLKSRQDRRRQAAAGCACPCNWPWPRGSVPQLLVQLSQGPCRLPPLLC